MPPEVMREVKKISSWLFSMDQQFMSTNKVQESKDSYLFTNLIQAHFGHTVVRHVLRCILTGLNSYEDGLLSHR